MKKTLLCSLALVAGISIFSCGNSQTTAKTVAATTGEAVKATGVVFATEDFTAILAKAKSEDKPVFMDVYASWCPPCKHMTNKIFPQKEVGDFFNSGFICAKFDAEKGEGIAIAAKYGVTAYPTFLFLDGDGKEIGRIVGGTNSGEEFIESVKALELSK